jgi:hypothetical protein
MTSPTFMVAAATWRQLRAEFEVQRENAYARAEEACNGALLNARGRATDVDPYSLFIGNESRALAYASEELVEHWQKHPRMTFAEFERQYFDPEGSAA